MSKFTCIFIKSSFTLGEHILKDLESLESMHIYLKYLAGQFFRAYHDQFKF